jgi:hypothetical protein
MSATGYDPGRIYNAGKMSEFVRAFEVRSPLTGDTYHCRFSHLHNGISPRHSDTVDAIFLVDGHTTVVGLAHTAFVDFHQRAGRGLTDREGSYVAAAFLAERLEQADPHPIFNVSHDDVLRLLQKLEIK